MGTAMFYHLTSGPLEDTLPVLLRRSLGAGWRVEVRGTSIERLAWLDERLWLGDQTEFLPHGVAGGPHDARQPVLLTCSTAAAPETQCLMAVDGAEVAADEARRLERVCVLFDGGNSASVQFAREQWKLLTTGGIAAQYWAQDDGRWTKKSETAAKS